MRSQRGVGQTARSNLYAEPVRQQQQAPVEQHTAASRHTIMSRPIVAAPVYNGSKDKTLNVLT
jgi:hypothetical protein